jgi:hypothetical protein
MSADACSASAGQTRHQLGALAHQHIDPDGIVRPGLTANARPDHERQPIASALLARANCERQARPRAPGRADRERAPVTTPVMAWCMKVECG